MSKTLTLLLTLALVCACGCAWAGNTIYGLTGLIETPDDRIAGQSAISLAGTYISDFGDSDSSIFTYGGSFGLMPKLEIGAVGLDSDAPGSDTEAILGAKFRIAEETFSRPSITVGVVDAGDALDRDPGAFVVIGRNLTSAAESFGGVVSKPLRGTLGFGTGLYKGVFAGLNWSLSDKTEVMVEYLAKGLRDDSSLNAGIRMNTGRGLTLQLGAMGFKDFYGGATYTISTY